jgi:hypothetical protein
MSKALHKDTISMPSNIVEATATNYGLLTGSMIIHNNYSDSYIKAAVSSYNAIA